MSIAPDVKNWTWVLERSCPECGFDASTVAYDTVAGLTRDYAGRMVGTLGRKNAAERPDVQTWSPMEYAAHVRDVCRIFAYRMAIAARTDAVDPRVPGFAARGQDADETPDGMPVFSDWDQNITAVMARYSDQNPATVAGELTVAAETMAQVLESIPAPALGLRVRRSDGSVFTVETLSRYFVHDVIHHVHDVKG